MKLLNKLAVLLLLITLFHSCAEESDDDDDDNIIPKSTINFDPIESEWFVRSAPDSIVVKISGGNPPYHIAERSEFAAQSVIRNNELHLFPSQQPSNLPTQLGFDFLTIQDNNESVKNYNLEVKLDSYNFDELIINNLEITGDTTLHYQSLFILNAIYDRFSKSIFIYLGTNTNTSESFRLSIEDVKLGNNEVYSGFVEYRIVDDNNAYNIFRLTTLGNVNVTKLSTEELSTLVGKAGL